MILCRLSNFEKHCHRAVGQIKEIIPYTGFGYGYEVCKPMTIHVCSLENSRGFINDMFTNGSINVRGRVTKSVVHPAPFKGKSSLPEFFILSSFGHLRWAVRTYMSNTPLWTWILVLKQQCFKTKERSIYVFWGGICDCHTVQSSSSTLLTIIKSLKMKLEILNLWAGANPTSPAPHKASWKGHLLQLFSILLSWARATLFPIIPNCSSSRDWWIDFAGWLFEGPD